MAALDQTTTRGRVEHTARRLTTETKQFFKTSEFGAYVIVFIGILIAANSIEAEGGNDYFTADKAWLYITILTLGYMLSRGIAKSGVRDPYDADSGNNHRDNNHRDNNHRDNNHR